MGIRKHDIVTSMVEMIAHQIFVAGFVHADPHPGLFSLSISISTSKCIYLIIRFQFALSFFLLEYR